MSVDSGDQGQNGLRRLRASSKKRRLQNERSDKPILILESAIEEEKERIIISCSKINLWNTGVKTVEINRKQGKVTVIGFVDENRVLKKVRRTGKMAELWPYVPYNVVAYPYVAQAYDKRAPAGFVKNAVQAVPSPNAVDEKLTTMFSDDNPNGCFVM